MEQKLDLVLAYIEHWTEKSSPTHNHKYKTHTVLHMLSTLKKQIATVRAVESSVHADILALFKSKPGELPTKIAF